MTSGQEFTTAVPGVNCNENPVEDPAKLAKVMVSHNLLHRLLNLPDDVVITSMHTIRGEEETGIYMMCDRFERVAEGMNAPQLTLEDVYNRGLWDSEEN